MRTARRCGTDAATALLAEGQVCEETFYRALARHLGTPFLAEGFVLGEELRYPDCLVVGAAPLAPGGARRLVAAPRGRAVARLIAAAGRMEHPPAITTPTALRLAVFAREGDGIAREASDGLQRRHPEWSCRPGLQAVDLALVAVALALLTLLIRLPTVTSLVLLALVQALMIALLTFRLAAVAMNAAPEAVDQPRPGLPDDTLPTYTVLIALHREARVVPRLVHSLGRLDYPAAKLDIKFLLETGDDETASALGALLRSGAKNCSRAQSSVACDLR